jgi:hypothetical protein
VLHSLARYRLQVVHAVDPHDSGLMPDRLLPSVAPYRTPLDLPPRGGQRAPAAIHAFCRPQRRARGPMTDQEKPPRTSRSTAADNAKQEAGEREQGVRSEDSEDLSSPQLTGGNDA